MEVECATVWTDCLKLIKEQVDEQNFTTWFKPIVPLRHEGDVLTIQVPSQFFYEWLEENYVPILKKAIGTVIGENARLEYSVIIDSGNQRNAPLTVNYPNGNGRHNLGPSNGNGNGHLEEYSPFTFRTLNPQTVNSRLNPSYRFENFVEGDCNRLARSAGEQ